MSQTQYVHARCPRCGETLAYDGGGRKELKCSNCKYRRALGRKTDQVENHPLTAGIQWKSFARGYDIDLVEKGCNSCKGVSGMHPDHIWERCPFCDGELKEAEAQSHRKFTPIGIIPFTVSQQQGREALKGFLRNFFIPPKLKEVVLAEGGLRGIYVPMFFMDILTRSTWEAQIFMRYRQPKRDNKSKDKNEKPKEVWDRASGYYEHFYEDEQRFLTKGLNANIFKQILPYNLKSVAPYDPIYLTEWPVEIYPQREGDEIKNLEKDLVKRLESEAKKLAKGDKVKDFKLKSEKFLITFRHVLMPVWVANYRYRGKNYQYLINGQTGKLSGPRPLSTLRILIAIGVVLTLLSILMVVLTS